MTAGMAEMSAGAVAQRRGYWQRYKDRLKATWLVCTAINVAEALVHMGAGDAVTVLLSPSLAAGVQWGILLAVQMLWGLVYALPVNLLVAAFPGRRATA